MTLIAILISGCTQETTVNAFKPGLAVAPTELDFGEQTVPLSTSGKIYITNNGRATLEVDISVSGDGAQAYTLDVDSQDIAPQDSWTLPISFLPDSYLDYPATLTITSNDEDNPVAEVKLNGTGVYAPIPVIDVDPMTLDFGDVTPPLDILQYVTIHNSGEADLVIGEISQVGAGTFALVTDPSNSIIAGGNELPVLIQYIPSHGDGDSGELIIPSNDETTPETTVIFLGNGGGNFAYPEAIIDCPGVSAPPTWVNLSGANSNDPNGQTPLEYSWTLVDKPAGSQSSLTNQSTDQTSIFHDIAGNYVVELSVTNAVGTSSAPDRCTITATPSDEFHVELTWDTPGADLDLHVLEEDASLYEKPGDCNWCNTNPKWGQTGADDDPRLDIDDQGGWGPENINIQTPTDGEYSIKIHYFEEHGDNAVTALVKVYTYGSLAWSGSKIVYRDEVWDVGVVNWPNGTLGVQSVAPYPAATRLCY
jgi:hypothetical protein